MSVNSVRKHLKKHNLLDHLFEENTTCKTVSEAANSIGCKDEEIAKTLSFDLDGETIVIVMAGDKKIDNAKYRAYFHKKAKMLSFDEVEKRTSHVPGGVTPYGLNENVKVYLDESLKAHNILYPSGGDTNWVIKISLEELKNSLDFTWVDVTK